MHAQSQRAENQNLSSNGFRPFTIRRLLENKWLPVPGPVAHRRLGAPPPACFLKNSGPTTSPGPAAVA